MLKALNSLQSKQKFVIKRNILASKILFFYVFFCQKVKILRYCDFWRDRLSKNQKNN